MNIDKAEYQLITELVERIDEFRVKNNHSIYQLANKADTSINTIKHLYKKKGFPNIHTVYNICEALEIPIKIPRFIILNVPRIFADILYFVKINLSNIPLQIFRFPF